MITPARQLCVLLVVASAAWSTTPPAHAQLLQPNRFEKIQKNSDDYYHVISLNEDGLALIRERDKYKNSNRMWEVVLLDSTLQQRKVLDMEIKERNKMIGYEVAAPHIFFLFRTGETNRNDFELIDVTYDGEEVGRYTIKPDLDFRLTHFSKVSNNFVLGGYVSNEAAILLYDMGNNSMKVVPGFFQKDTELVDLRVNQNQTFNTVLVDRSSRDDRKLIFRTFDETGKQLLEDVVHIEENRTLNTGITSTLEREDLMVLGTWGEKNSKQSYGFYALNVDPFSEQKIQYIDFGRMGHFVDYLSPKRAARIKANAKEDAAAGDRPSFSAHVMPFRVKENKEGFILLAEVYTPQSNINPYYSNPYYYNPFYSPYGFNPYWPGGYYYPGMSRFYRPYNYYGGQKTPDEIKTHESVVVAFDGSGKVLWDESFKLDDIKILNVEQVSDFYVNRDRVHMLYKKEMELRLKTAYVVDDEQTELTEKIKPLESLDEIRSERNYEGGVRHWYKNTFYVWGYQTIRNIKKEDRIREVFYINKVVAP